MKTHHAQYVVGAFRDAMDEAQHLYEGPMPDVFTRAGVIEVLRAVRDFAVQVYESDPTDESFARVNNLSAALFWVERDGLPNV